MVSIQSIGFNPQQSEEKRAAQLRLFIDNIDLILEQAEEILRYRDLFFCAPDIAWCSWPYFGGDGPLSFGFLISGWYDGILLEPCPDCGKTVLVYCFGGSPLSGSNSWTGVCVVCREEKSARDSVHKPFADKISFVCSLRKAYPFAVKEWEEFDGFQFTWAGDGLKPVRKKRLVTRFLAEPVDFEHLIDVLRGRNFTGLSHTLQRKNLTEELKLDLKLKISR